MYSYNNNNNKQAFTIYDRLILNYLNIQQIYLHMNFN